MSKTLEALIEAAREKLERLGCCNCVMGCGGTMYRRANGDAVCNACLTTLELPAASE